MYLDGFDLYMSEIDFNFLLRKKAEAPFLFILFFHFYVMDLLGENGIHLVDFRRQERNVVESVACGEQLILFHAGVEGSVGRDKCLDRIRLPLLHLGAKLLDFLDDYLAKSRMVEKSRVNGQEGEDIDRVLHTVNPRALAIEKDLQGSDVLGKLRILDLDLFLVDLLLGDLFLVDGDLFLGDGVAGLEACVVAMHGGVEWLGLTFL
jgi:hypothetical protein